MKKMNNFNYQVGRTYLVTRNMYEGFLIENHQNGCDIVAVQPRELIINKKKMGEFRTLTVSARGLAEPGTYGELYEGNQVYEVEFKSDMSYKLRPRTFVPASLGLATSIPVLVNGKLSTFDMNAAEFILRCKVGNEYSEIRDAVEKLYDAVVSNPSISISEDGVTAEEAVAKRVLAAKDVCVAVA